MILVCSQRGISPPPKKKKEAKKKFINFKDSNKPYEGKEKAHLELKKNIIICIIKFHICFGDVVFNHRLLKANLLIVDSQ